MKFFTSFLTLLFSFLFSLTAFLGIIFFVNPFEAGMLSIGLFYLTFFLTGFSLFSLLGLIIRKRYFENQFRKSLLAVSVRQSFFLAFVLVVYLLFQNRGGLNWWKGFLPLIFVALLEFYFQNIGQKQGSKNRN